MAIDHRLVGSGTSRGAPCDGVAVGADGGRRGRIGPGGKGRRGFCMIRTGGRSFGRLLGRGLRLGGAISRGSRRICGLG